MSANPTEAGLLARARGGEHDALTEIFRRYGQQVLDVAFRITQSTDEADDVLQDIFIGLPDALRGYDGSGSLGAWMRRVATRASLLRLRTERRRSKWQERAAREGRAQQEAPSVESRLTLQRYLDRMPADLRVVYMLKEVEGYAHGEIADLLGITAAASEVRLHRARRFLKDRLRGKI
ncbi:MAG TPA: sigma-70 family RNA polymerase sigma factor [Longimicrobiales bacterium]|nr:sigma-70 family RNA polymerase sigma factor [Longimicrobiales bacterium]